MQQHYPVSEAANASIGAENAVAHQGEPDLGQSMLAGEGGRDPIARYIKSILEPLLGVRCGCVPECSWVGCSASDHFFNVREPCAHLIGGCGSFRPWITS